MHRPCPLPSPPLSFQACALARQWREAMVRMEAGLEAGLEARLLDATERQAGRREATDAADAADAAASSALSADAERMRLHASVEGVEAEAAKQLADAKAAHSGELVEAEAAAAEEAARASAIIAELCHHKAQAQLALDQHQQESVQEAAAAAEEHSEVLEAHREDAASAAAQHQARWTRRRCWAAPYPVACAFRRLGAFVGPCNS